VEQCHGEGVCHGDIKSENVLVTSWNWLLLTDFASFKPVYLPEDDHADFSYVVETNNCTPPPPPPPPPPLFLPSLFLLPSRLCVSGAVTYT